MRARSKRDGPATRERLIAAALELFMRSGFLRTTTPMLAERAGVAEGTIYRHFKSKEALLNEAFSRAHRWAFEAVSAIDRDRARRAPDRLAMLARHLVDLATRDPGLAAMLLSTGNEPFLTDTSRGARRAFMEALAQLVAMGKSDGQIRAGPAELWAQIWLAIVSVAVRRIATGEWVADSAPVTLTLEAARDAIAIGPASWRGPDNPSEDGQTPWMA
jgi:AcrR family transcriptional regulator